MIPKAIRYVAHSLMRLKQRGFTRADVRFLLARGERSKATSLHGAQRWEAKGYVGGREAAVIFIETAYDYLIITVEWVGEKPGESD